MTNQTPPAWAHKTAVEVSNKCHFPAMFHLDLAAQIIASQSPDAEALAQALETIDAELKEYNDGECICDHSVGICYCAYNSIREQMGQAISAYRARFPLAPVAVEIAPAVELVAVAE